MSGAGMSDAMRTALRRRGAVPALLAATGVLAALLVQGVLLGLINTMTLAGMPGAPSSLGYLWAGQLQGALTNALPLAVGVLLSLWLLAPIVPELRLVHVVLRALLATAVGALLVVAVAVIVGFLGSLAGLNFFSASFPDLAGPLRSSWFAVLQGVTGAFRAFVVNSPIVVLAAVLLWGWPRRHPLPHEAAGAPDGA